MTHLALLVLALAVPADGATKEATKAPPAKVTITAELACLHCTFGEGDGCAACLKLDEKTPIVLAGKCPDEFVEQRLKKKVVVCEGTLALNKDKRMLLTIDNAHFYTDKDKDTAPAVGQVRVVGDSCCAHCDLKIASECTVAVRNADSPIVLDGKLAHECLEDSAKVTLVGRPFLDKNGLLRVEAKTLDVEKKK
jgi:hypothetical protein